jgi:hypothetical protein
MKWSTWAFSHATGTGILRLKNCIPSCANGKARDYNVTVHFDMPTQTAKSGWLWDRMTFYFPDSSPYGRSTVVQSNLAAWLPLPIFLSPLALQVVDLPRLHP